ncbi:MAG: hypothetical protein SF029_02465 [bacterium]|nr:hypothetical protein [bacterium]
MQTIKVDARVGQDGILKLELPLEVSNADLEVLVVVQRKEKRGWPSGYFERTAGSLADDPIERPSQGEYEERDGLL